jgi:hypothetical protein
MRTIRTTILATILATNLTLGAAARAGSVPTSAQTQELRVKVTTADGEPRTLTARVAADRHDYFLFPVFRVERATITHGYGEAEPLVDLRGKVPHRYLEARIAITLRDYLRTDDAEAVLAEIEDARAVRGKERGEPDLLDEWTATLAVRDRDGGAFVTIGTPFTFTRDGNGEISLEFALSRADERAFALFQAAGPKDLRLEVTAGYNAKYTTTDFRVAGSLMDDAVRELVAAVTAKDGDRQPLLFVSVGGDVDHDFGFRELFRRRMDFVIEKRAGAAVDQSLVTMFLDRVMQRFETKVKLSAEDGSTVVSFLLSNGLRVTTPISEVKKLADALKTEDESKVRDLMESLSKDQRKENLTAEASAKAFGFGGSAKFGKAYEEMSEDQKKEEHERFVRDLDEMSRMVEGSFPSVAAMRLEQLQQLSSGTFFEEELVSNTFTEGVKDLSLRFVLDDAGLRDARVTRAFTDGLRRRILYAGIGWQDYAADTMLEGATSESMSEPLYPGDPTPPALTISFYGEDRVALREVAESVRRALPDGWSVTESPRGIVATGAGVIVSVERGSGSNWVSVTIQPT